MLKHNKLKEVYLAFFYITVVYITLFFFKLYAKKDEVLLFLFVLYGAVCKKTTQQKAHPEEPGSLERGQIHCK